MNYPFTKPVPFKTLGRETDQSYWGIRRLVQAGIAPIVRFPNGFRVRPDWANRYVQEGLTDSELKRLTAFNRSEKEAREAKSA